MVHFLDEDQQKLGLSTKKLEYEPGEMLRDPQRVYEEAEATAAAYRERFEVQWHTYGPAAAAALAWGQQQRVC
jgi:small subunit ribosomal protein S1